MKNSIFLIALGLVLLTGCSKEESNEQFEEQTIDSVYVLKQIDGTTTWEATSIDGLQTGTNLSYTAEDPYRSVHTDGDFISSSRDTNTITWSGTEHERRTFGNAELHISTPAYSLQLILETECVTVDGDAAVYGGIVTEVLERSGNPPPFGVNWRFYFKVIDYGGANNGLFDQISNVRIFASPRSPSLCNLSPADRIWSSQGYENVYAPGFVNVWAIAE